MYHSPSEDPSQCRQWAERRQRCGAHTACAARSVTQPTTAPDKRSAGHSRRIGLRPGRHWPGKSAGRYSPRPRPPVPSRARLEALSPGVTDTHGRRVSRRVDLPRWAGDLLALAVHQGAGDNASGHRDHPAVGALVACTIIARTSERVGHGKGRGGPTVPGSCAGSIDRTNAERIKGPERPGAGRHDVERTAIEPVSPGPSPCRGAAPHAAVRGQSRGAYPCFQPAPSSALSMWTRSEIR